jgi:hypothetical protein
MIINHTDVVTYSFATKARQTGHLLQRNFNIIKGSNVSVYNAVINNF